MNKSVELSINSNTIRLRRKKQDWIKISCSPSDLTLLNIEKYFESITFNGRNVFDLLLKFTLCGRKMFFTQSWIAQQCGISRAQVSRILRKLEEDGLIVSNYRHMTSCLYKISHCFKNPFIQSRLSHIFKSFRITALLLGMGASGTNVTQCIIKKYNDIYTPKHYASLLDTMGLKIWGLDKRVSPELENLPISQEQKINLSAFPDNIINYAILKSLVIVNIENLAGYIYTVCSERCKALKITPDWGWVNKLKDLHTQHVYEGKKIMEKQPKPIPVFEEEDNYSYEYTENNKKQSKIAEPRRSREGMSPVDEHELQPKQERLIPYGEFQERLERTKNIWMKMNIEEQKINAELQKMKDKQNQAYLQSTTEEKITYKQQRDTLHETRNIQKESI